jgi:hypothetical protein
MFRQICSGVFVAGAFQAGVQFRSNLAQVRHGTPELLFPLADIRVDLMLMGKKEGNRPVHLLQRKRREVLLNGFRRIAVPERINDGIEGDTRAGHVESTVALLDIIAARHALHYRSFARGSEI